MTTLSGGTLVLRPGEGEAFDVGPDRITVRARSRAGRFELAEYAAAPGVPGPPLHRHGELEETWYILDGEVRFRVGDEDLVLGAGDSAFVPAGAVHTFRVGAAPARWLGIFSPATGIAMLQELGALLREGPPDPARIGALLAAHDTEVLGPPLG